MGFRSSTTASALATSLTVNKPTGTALGDILIACIGAEAIQGVVNIPAGWTQLAHFRVSASVFSGQLTEHEVMYVFSLTAGASEPASYNFTTTSAGTVNLVGSILAYQGYSKVDTNPTAQAQAIANGGTSLDSGPVITTVASETVVSLWLSDGGTVTVPVTQTSRASLNPGAGYQSIAAGDFTGPVLPGSVDPGSATSVSGNWNAYTLTLIPFTSGPGSALDIPLFRFEEGWNLSDIARKESKQLVHTNEVIKLGSGQVNSQLQGDAWSAQEVGNPAANIPKTYPIFETISNDDRAAVLSIVEALAQAEVTRGVDTTPSLTLQVLSSVVDAYGWVPGDVVWVKTTSLVNNVEQLMRIMKITHAAGSGTRTVTLGRIAWDPSMQQLLSKNMLMDWLYEQNAQFGTVLVYPYVGVLAANTQSSVWQFPLDTFSTGSGIISAELRWFTASGQPASDIAAWLNSAQILSTTSGNDSGSIDITANLASAQVYSLYFQNRNGASSRNLVSGFITVRLRL